jgi:branched-chain amino acid transport system substrate-binding protein
MLSYGSFRFLVVPLLGAFACVAAAPTSAQITLAQISSFTGAFAARVKENADGADAYFKKINAAGGVNGQKITLQRMDDENNPAKAGQLAKEVADKAEAVAIFMPGGTPNTDAISKITDELAIPVIAPSNGASIFHTPVRKSVFNLRATYQQEAQQLVRLLKELQQTKFALLYQDDAFGKDALVGANRGLEAAKLKPNVVQSFDRSKPDIDAVAAAVIASEAEIVIFLGSGGHAAPIYKKIKSAKPQILLAVISNNATAGFIKSLGELGRGVYVSQVMPGENSTAAVVREMAADFPGGRAAMSPAHIEGYMGAKLAVEALSRAGKRPSRAKLIETLENMKNVDLGGFVVSYSSTDHSGLDYIDLSIISRTGTFLR